MEGLTLVGKDIFKPFDLDGQQFDFIYSNAKFQLAPNEETFEILAQNIFNLTKPGGSVFVINGGVLNNGKHDARYTSEFILRYGGIPVEYDPQVVHDWMPFKMRFKDEALGIDAVLGAHFISIEIYERIFQKIGFEVVNTERARTLDSATEEEKEFYKDFSEVNNMISLTLRRPE